MHVQQFAAVSPAAFLMAHDKKLHTKVLQRRRRRGSSTDSRTPRLTSLDCVLQQSRQNSFRPPALSDRCREQTKTTSFLQISILESRVSILLPKPGEYTVNNPSPSPDLLSESLMPLSLTLALLLLFTVFRCSSYLKCRFSTGDVKSSITASNSHSTSFRSSSFTNFAAGK